MEGEGAKVGFPSFTFNNSTRSQRRCHELVKQSEQQTINQQLLYLPNQKGNGKLPLQNLVQLVKPRNNLILFNTTQTKIVKMKMKRRRKI